MSDRVVFVSTFPAVKIEECASADVETELIKAASMPAAGAAVERVSDEKTLREKLEKSPLGAYFLIVEDDKAVLYRASGADGWIWNSREQVEVGRVLKYVVKGVTVADTTPTPATPATPAVAMSADPHAPDTNILGEITRAEARDQSDFNIDAKSPLDTSLDKLKALMVQKDRHISNCNEQIKKLRIHVDKKDKQLVANSSHIKNLEDTIESLKSRLSEQAGKAETCLQKLVDEVPNSDPVPQEKSRSRIPIPHK